MTRGQIVGWTIWIGGLLAFAGYYAYQAHDPAVIADAKAQHAQEDRWVSQTFAQVGCADRLEGRDDGRAPAETVARTIVVQCGPVIWGPQCGTDPKCLQERQRTSLQVETKSVLEKRYERAQARADEAKAALEYYQSH